MKEDVREKTSLNHQEVVGLNFVKDSRSYFFRRHYKQGLRSHVMEVLRRDDVKRERTGVVIEGVRWFPKAKPIKILRIFRTKFKSLDQALEEVNRVKIIEKYLAPDHVAMSDEFLVDYVLDGKREFILCGLQEAVAGEILDPWSPITKEHLAELFSRMSRESTETRDRGRGRLIQRAQKRVNKFIQGVKRMILEANHVPDLAGVGNLLLTPEGEVKLVDINNISSVSFGPNISIDDKGYPVCDKSIQALALLEQKILGKAINKEDAVYKTFLDAQRMRRVKVLEDKFHFTMVYPEYDMD
ncbi:MAG: hypothetical protein JSW56_12730 [Deltaproteobacteria bacterium]|nr:MAG: hypothetical protein JSW56_12730 [Deltaproteobacteria bacterium]